MAAPQPVVEVDDDTETDSAFGDDTESATTSVAESIYNYRKEHGRTYHAYRDGKYWIPNDERESDRLADMYPDCSVKGTDLSPTQPQFVPPNLEFIIDDAEDEWLFRHKFDYIHLRLMAGTFESWEKVIQSAFDNLEPGGWLEIQDYDMPCKSDDNTLAGTKLELWASKMVEGARKMGRPVDQSPNYRRWMQEIGFVDIQEQRYVWPTNCWPRDPKLKELGKWSLVNLNEGMDGFTLAIFTRVLGWTKPEVDVLCAQVRADLRNRSIHAYFSL
ncbi:S-adenosyl-L-methionine-dependent methyltransferase [Pseudovirgaria hyperparasitica]|uniref:S-adenosyl-L-methionine-dependent methyltransferase n=1 Tax=Pseudovirgaria hyperparasitica TaxID=470096 RepID=A0A6A6VUL3_9PEZI|nr:S-adenosyl-L-methionine-dependent methyltransferase [Pseudovirgaria hyperparasitica]KAF2753913.1 S-adenosyl-L-methionine-dependent methyltransferase [Pseudovirgaria hyperparasitica]